MFLCVHSINYIQYVQTKRVLKQRFDEFNHLLNDPTYCTNVGFDINLPRVQFKSFKDIDQLTTDQSAEREAKTRDNNNKDNITCTDIYIHDDDFPVSLIAQKLYNDDDIIEAFQRLYSKYINEKDAPFMINISSENRTRLKLSLHNQYYSRNCGLSNLTNKMLLLKLVSEMDKAAFEVSQIMLGSFARFQTSMKQSM